MVDKQAQRDDIEQHPGEERFLTDAGGSADHPRPSSGTRAVNSDAPTPDSGFFGVGSSAAAGDDNDARETEPGYQDDKWDRGTVMPR